MRAGAKCSQKQQQEEELEECWPLVGRRKRGVLLAGGMKTLTPQHEVLYVPVVCSAQWPESSWGFSLGFLGTSCDGDGQHLGRCASCCSIPGAPTPAEIPNNVTWTAGQRWLGLGFSSQTCASSC